MSIVSQRKGAKNAEKRRGWLCACFLAACFSAILCVLCISALNRDWRWSAAEIAGAIHAHLNDPNWLPQEIQAGGYVVKTSDGGLVPPPTTKQRKVE